MLKNWACCLLCFLTSLWCCCHPHLQVRQPPGKYNIVFTPTRALIDVRTDSSAHACDRALLQNIACLNTSTVLFGHLLSSAAACTLVWGISKHNSCIICLPCTAAHLYCSTSALLCICIATSWLCCCRNVLLICCICLFAPHQCVAVSTLSECSVNMAHYL